MKTLIIILVISFVTLNSKAQWETDIRLTDNSGNSYVSYGNTSCIATSGSYVHVVWWNLLNVNWEIFYKRSSDNGLTWTSDTKLTNDTAISDYPAISVWGSVVHVVWRDMRDGNNEIYYKRSTDSGINWSSDLRLTSNSASSSFPSVNVSGSDVHVVWNENRDGNFEIYYKHSTNGGLNWGNDTRLTNNSYSSLLPSISSSGSIIHVVWYDNRDGNNEIYYKFSTNDGITWGLDSRLTNNSATSIYPSISVSGPIIHLVWEDFKNGNSDLYYKRSTDAGINWESDVRLTIDPDYSTFPSVLVSASNVHIVWIDGRDGNNEVYYKCSSDGGSSWQSDVRLTNNTSDSENPFLSVSGTVVNVVWYDYRDGNYELYYKRNPTGNVIGILPIGNEIPNFFSLAQNYPNPFNPTTNIEFDIPKESFVKLSIYDLLSREVERVVNETLVAGAYRIGWDASKFSSGMYFYQLQAGEFAETKKMLLVK